MNMQNHGAFDFKIVAATPPKGIVFGQWTERLPSRIELCRFGKPSTQAIVDAAAVASGFRRAELTGATRRQELVAWRIAAYETITWLVPQTSNCRIAARFNRDPSTVWHARSCYRQDPVKYEEQIHAIRAVLVFNMKGMPNAKSN